MSNKSSAVSISVVRRLPRYYRFLSELLKDGKTRISSRELSDMMQLTASQIRQDLNCFGGFGQQGYGYNVKDLHEEIANILGLNKIQNCILIGVGNLGEAIANHIDFEKRGFKLVGAFDINPELIGTKIGGVVIRHSDEIEEFCKDDPPKIAVLCIPKESAQAIAERLVALGIKGFWNFSHFDLTLSYDDIVVENVHLSDSLMTLCYRVNEIFK
ncbi:MAG: redox-sensing transcriptional repressor Rex [Oscillospiraceae bacterium]|nr:redox-sensing transcriptional repressor Rex [Oscillospiraceae bacterium]